MVKIGIICGTSQGFVAVAIVSAGYCGQDLAGSAVDKNSGEEWLVEASWVVHVWNNDSKVKVKVSCVENLGFVGVEGSADVVGVQSEGVPAHGLLRGVGQNPNGLDDSENRANVRFVRVSSING